MRIACVLRCAVTASLAAACHDLPDLGTCGNGVTEEANGEACDDGRETTTCNETCELKCTPTQVGTYAELSPGVFCPDTRYRCGADTICRAPSGEFEGRSSAERFNVGGSPVIGDVDNDGLPDLVGTSATSIYIRFASTTGAPLGDVIVQEAPSSEAPLVIFDRDPAGSDPNRSDLMAAVPTEGVALLRSDDERFAPELDLPIEVKGETQGMIVRDPDPRLGDVVVTVQSTSSSATILVDRVGVKSPVSGIPDPVDPESLPSCVGAGGGAWRTVDIEAAADRRSFVVVTRREDATAWHVCRYTHVGGAWSLAQLDFPAAAPQEAVLANLDGDPCLELAVRGGAVLAMVDAAVPGCGFAPGVAPVPLLGPASALLAAGQITALGLDELVLAKGVYRACAGPEECGAAAPGTFVSIGAPTKVDWSAAAVVDLNGDGALDVVAARSFDSDVDIVRGGGTLNVYRADTSARITSLVAGDFDGDRLGDVAMTESSGMMGERIVVLFGTQESIVGTPLPMSGPRAGLLRLDRATEINWIPSRRGSDGVDDLLVVSLGTATEAPRAGLVIGDAARLLTTPRFPPTPPPDSDLDALDGVAAGAFRTGAMEILAFEDSLAVFYDLMMNSWSTPISISAPLRGPVGVLRDGPRPAWGAAVDGATQELVVFSVRNLTQLREECRIPPQATPLREVRGIDVDRDGIDEVAALYEMGAGSRRLRLFSAACQPVLTEALPNCADVVDVGGRLVAICRDDPNLPGPARQVISIAIEGGVLVRSEIDRFQGGDARFATAGDFDGDGVLDVAISVHRVDEVGVHFLRQCPEHDTRACPPPRRLP